MQTNRQKEYPARSPDPYTPEELDTVVKVLGPKVARHDREVIVGIARGFADQRRYPSNKFAKEVSEWQKATSDAAKKAADALVRLAKLCGPFDFLPLPLSTVVLVEQRLRGFHQSNKAERAARAGVHKAGRKPPDHITVAMAQFLCLWAKYHSGIKGRRAFLAAALAPLDYDASENAFTTHINDAMALLSVPQ